MSERTDRRSCPAPARQPVRLILFRLLLVVAAPLVFFGLVEGALRIAGFGHSTDFFIPDEQPGFHRTNPRFTELFFPASFGLKPANFRLPREKPPGSLRVFVLGESAAMGVPEPAFALAPQLQAQLRSALPGRRVDVYNLGVTAINSHAIRRIAREAVAFQPDLFVVYMGNNEVVGPYGPSSVVTGSTPPAWLVRAGLAARSSRVGQLLQRAIAAMRPAGGFRDWRGMEMFAGNTVPADDPRLGGVYANFSANLDDILAAARSAGVRTVLCTVAVNVRDCAPFAPEPAADAPAALAEAERAVVLGEPERARSVLTTLLARAPGHAGAHYQLARVLDAAGETASARAHYLRALEGDTLRFRTTERLNAIVRRAGTGEGVVLVDAARELGSDPASTAAPAGNNHFFEHVHFRWEGTHALARLVAPAALAALSGQPATETRWLDSAACAAAVGYTGFGHVAMARTMTDLTNRPPFTGQSTYGADRTRLAVEVAQAETALATPEAVRAAVRAVETVAAREDADPMLLFQAAAVQLAAGDFAAALALSDRLLAAAPFSPEAAVQRAFALQRLGRGGEAEEFLLRAAREYPYYFQTYDLLAQLWAGTGRGEHALEYFRGLLARMPDSRAVRSAHAQLLAHASRWNEAEQEWRAMLAVTPDDDGALVPLCDRLLARGAAEEALGLLRNAARYNPRSFAAHQRLAAIWEERGDTAQLTASLQALAESGPVNALLYRDLALNLRRLGREEEAKVALRRGLATLAWQEDAALRAELVRLLQ